MEYFGPIAIYTFICFFVGTLTWAIGWLIMMGIGVLLGLATKSASITKAWMILTHILSAIYLVWCIIGWVYGITHMSHVQPG